MESIFLSMNGGARVSPDEREYSRDVNADAANRGKYQGFDVASAVLAAIPGSTAPRRPSSVRGANAPIKGTYKDGPPVDVRLGSYASAT